MQRAAQETRAPIASPCCEMRMTTEWLSSDDLPGGITPLRHDTHASINSVADTDAVLRFDYLQAKRISPGKGTKVIDLGGYINHHWTKNLIATADGTHLYVTVGATATKERTASMRKPSVPRCGRSLSRWQHRIYASGLRNRMTSLGARTGPWTTVNELMSWARSRTGYMTALRMALSTAALQLLRSARRYAHEPQRPTRGARD